MNWQNRQFFNQDLYDYGPEPLVINIERFTKLNPYYRVTIWTGDNLQVVLMSVNPGENIGPEVHTTHDQFLRIESGNGIVMMGDSPENLYYSERINDDTAIMVPMGTWHNIVNIGNTPLKLYTIYAPPHHPYGTIHETKEIAEEAEE